MTRFFNPYAAQERYIERMRAGMVARRSLNQQGSIEDQLLNVPADGQPIHIVYGHRQVGGKMFALAYNSGTWTIGYIVCLGEIESYLSVWVNGVDALASPAISGLQINTYTGTTSQTKDGLLTVAFGSPEYDDDMVIQGVGSPQDNIGVAYVVIQYSDDLYETIPEVIAEIQGKKVIDPRTSPRVPAYSTNFALFLGDYMASSQYGAGRTNDATTLAALADACDDTTQTSPNEVLRKGGLVLDDAKDIDSWIEILRAYAGGWVVERGDTAYYVVDTTGSSVMTINESDVIEGSVRIRKRDSSQVPTVVRATYTDTTPDKWRSALCDPAKASGVDAGTTPWRESRINLEGVDRHSEAYRTCVERLNKLQLQDLEIAWQQFDEALELEVGDIVTFSHPLLGSPSSKLLRLTEIPVQVRPGRWELVGEEYDPAVYDGSVVEAATYNDGGLPSGGKPTPPSGLSVTSVPFQTEDGFWKTRFEISWNAPTDGSLVTHYYISVIQADVSPNVPVWDTQIPASQTSTATPALEENANFTVSVYSINAVITGDPVVTAATLNGNATPPSDVTGLTVTVTGTTLVAKWVAAADAVQYDVRYYPTSGGSFATGTAIDKVYGLAATTNNIDRGSPEQTNFTLGVKSVDSSGNEGDEVTQTFSYSGGTDGVTIFFQGQSTDGIPTANATGDVWYDTDNDDRAYVATNAGDNEIGVSPQEWVLQNETLQTKLDLAYVNVVTTKQSSNFNASAQNRYPIDTSGGVVTMTLPANPSAGSRVQFFDTTGDFDVNNFTIARNTGSPQEKIIELDEDLVVDVRYFAGELQYIDSTIGWTLA